MVVDSWFPNGSVKTGNLWTLIIVFWFLLSADRVSAQNKKYADEALIAFNSGHLTKVEMFDEARKIAHNHPDFTVALSFAKTALNLAEEMDDPFRKAQAYEEIGLNERLLGNNEKSIDATLKALEIFDELGKEEYKAASYAQLGSNLVSDGESNNAIEYLTLSKNIYAKGENVTNYALSLINLGEAHRLSDQLDSAIHNFSLALNLNSSLKNEIIEGYARGNLGMALRSKGGLGAAEAELNPAIEILTKLGDPYSVSVYTAELAQISLARGNIEQAESQFLEAYQMAKEEGLKEQIRDFSEMLTDYYESQRDFESALGYQKVFQVYQDSLVNKANVQYIERLKANYQIEKRDGEIELLSTINANQRSFNMALGGGILIFGVLVVMLYQSNRQKNEANGMLARQQAIVTKREEEKALLLKELNHRVKNNLQMVSSLLSLQGNQLEGHPAAEAINAGKSRVEALSLIHQKLYQDDVHTTINIQEYLDQLVSNLFYSFGDPFQPALNIGIIEMDIDTAIPLSLIVNELVTNALKYAYTNIEHQEMYIGLNKPNGQYLLEVSDNGVGLDKDKDISNSFGLKLVRSLVSQLDGTLQMKDNPQGGITWVITLPVQEETN
ncbi:MAG: hypothetical protein Roseis2KO_54570 [Roseivirga sp.]